MLKSLKNIIELYKFKKIICIGQSAGGYMSILFGNLLNVNKIVAFVPQINIYTVHMNKFRYQLIDKYKLLTFKYKNLNILQPFNVYTKIYTCGDNIDIDQINFLNFNDKNLLINYYNKNKNHNIVNEMGKDNYIKLIIDEINDL